MFKRLFFALTIVAMATACNNTQSNKKQSETPEQNQEVVQIAEIGIDDFIFDAGKYAGKDIKIKGTIVHVCSHGGKRLFLMGEDPEQRIEVTPAEGMTVFDKEWEGSDVEITGVVSELRVDEQYLQDWETQVRANEGEPEKEIHTGEEGHEHHEGDLDHTIQKIEGLRKQIAESGNDHLSFYSIICNEYKLKE